MHTHRFRGAKPGIFEVFKTAYQRAGVTAMLVNNYRSTRQVCKVIVCNRV